MKLTQIFARNNSAFGQKISTWASERDITCIEFIDGETTIEGIDGLVIFNQNQDLSKEIQEIRTLFDASQKPVQKIDINGTLAAGTSNFSLWLERNRCKSILLVGAENLCENPNLERYLDNIN